MLRCACASFRARVRALYRGMLRRQNRTIMKQVLSDDTLDLAIHGHRNNSAIVIGGGFGGLATAIRLQAAGSAVTLVEALERLGGRAYQLKQDGFTFDMGPSLITAPHLLEDLWKAAGRSFQEDLSLVPL